MDTMKHFSKTAILAFQGRSLAEDVPFPHLPALGAAATDALDLLMERILAH
jgi:hypothetical protein